MLQNSTRALSPVAKKMVGEGRAVAVGMTVKVGLLLAVVPQGVHRTCAGRSGHAMLVAVQRRGLRNLLAGG